MSRQEIFETLGEIFEDVFDREGIVLAEDTTAKDVEGWDSLTHIALLAAIEDEFNIKFNMKEVQGLKDLGAMVDAIEAAL